jgi:transcriptional regulator with XRE-family HTH domain
MIDFAPLASSKITQGEFAALVKVSRVTVSQWIKGTMGVHEMRKPRVARLLSVLDKATKDAKLPLRDVPREKRLDAIKAILVTYLRAPE